MLGLPSSTEVSRRMPKSAFYENLKMDGALRDSFTQDVEGFTLQNSLKAATLGVPDGERVHEVLVLEVACKARYVPEDVLAAIAQANAHKLVFVCTFEDEECAAVRIGKRLMVGEWAPAGSLQAALDATSMDTVWDSLASSVIYGDAGRPGVTVEERVQRDEKIAKLREECDRLFKRLNKERQPGRRIELYEQLVEKYNELKALEDED